MTITDLIEIAGRHPWRWLAACVSLPLLAYVVGLLAGSRGGHAPWKYAYSLLIYTSCVPGILAAVLTGYSLFFIRANLLHVDFLVYGLPIITMVATLSLIGRQVAFALIPGFDRLSGLMLLIGISFAVALFIVKTRVWIVFGSSLLTLLLIATLAFLLLKWSAQRLFH